MRIQWMFGLGIVLAVTASAAGAEWAPAEGPLATRWARDVTPENVHPEYPRPQLVRENWRNLNGLWDYAIRPAGDEAPNSYDGEILVPFPIESSLSGVMKSVGEDHRLWYRRTFSAPGLAQGERLLLNFGAVDWRATVWVNGVEVGRHQGGYDAFTFDITDALTGDGPQEIIVGVWDPTDKGYQPRGKQVGEPEGIWYTAVTGIWQTVWIEKVPAAYVKSLKITPDVDRSEVRVATSVGGRNDGARVRARLLDGDQEIAAGEGGAGAAIVLKISNAKLWSPDSPFLYDLEVELIGAGDAPVDRIESYVGMRKISLGKGADGFNRLLLNNEPLFQYGPLDQGWWPDGLYTAPTDEALRYDVEVTKQLGFNMARKHVKVEPARWYYHCDRLGLLVWQDMSSGDRYIRPDEADIERSPESADNFRAEYRQMIDEFYNHPSIVVWVPFNEGWGQFDTDAVLAWTKEYDPTRLVDGPSGWTDRGTGDMHDMHSYPGPNMPEPEEKRAVVLGEFGGLGLPVEGHLWWNKRNWGYRTFTDRDELQMAYERLVHNLRPMIGAGLAAAVYTQTTDVEGEVNGLLTYDRAIIKYDVDRLAALHGKLQGPQPTVKTTTLVPTSERRAQTWRYTTEQPPSDWFAPVFDDSGWREGKAGFGGGDPPGHRTRTPWTTSDIWIRRTFEISDIEPGELRLRIHHDEDAEVFINGQRVASLRGYLTSYEAVALGAVSAIRPGKNTLAIHCRQTGGGQYIDAGLVNVVMIPPAEK